MAIPVYVTECANPAGAAGVDYACLRAKSDDYISTTTIIDDIIRQSTFSKADVVAVVCAIKEYLKDALLNGENVYLGKNDFGFMYLGLKSRCFPQSAMTVEGFNPESYIVKAQTSVRFRPCTAMRTDAVGNYSVSVQDSDLYHPAQAARNAAWNAAHPNATPRNTSAW